MSSTKEHLQNFIGDNRTDKAIELLKKQFRGDVLLYNQVILFESQIRHATVSFHANQILLQEYNEQLSKVRSGLLDMCEFIPSNSILSSANAETNTLNIISNVKKWLIPAFMLFIAVSIILFTQYFFPQLITDSDMKKKSTISRIKQDVQKVKGQLETYINNIEKCRNTIPISKSTDTTYSNCYTRLITSLKIIKAEVPLEVQYKFFLDNVVDIEDQLGLVHQSHIDGNYDNWDVSKDMIIENFRALNLRLDSLNNN